MARAFFLFVLALIPFSAAPCLASRASLFNDDAKASTNQSQCIDASQYVTIAASGTSPTVLLDDDIVTVFIDGISNPDPGHWVGMFTPPTADLSFCPAVAESLKKLPDAPPYLPAVCTLPVKAQYLSADPGYLGCQHSHCANMTDHKCSLKLCSATLQFHVVNFRSDVVFGLFAGGFDTPCLVVKTLPMSFANPYQALHPHISAIGSDGTSMRITWVSGENGTQMVRYGDDTTQTTVHSSAAPISRDKMCGEPANGLGWHDPGYIHTAVMTGLLPEIHYNYNFGSDVVGWSENISFHAPPNAANAGLDFVVVGSMGKTSRDKSIEHASQPGAALVRDGIKSILPTPGLIRTGIDGVFHLGDTSMAAGFSLDWDYFLRFIEPIASRVSYMTTIGSVDRDYEGSGSPYGNASGGECGVPYRSHFQMPTPAPDKPWFSMEQGPVHFSFISSEHDWTVGSEQYNWINHDLENVDHDKTPWMIVLVNRPMYSSVDDQSKKVAPEYRKHLEPMIVSNKVDLVLSGHVHNYERTCQLFDAICLNYPDNAWHDTYIADNITAPVHVNVGTGGATLDSFSKGRAASWSIARIADFGYLRLNAAQMDLTGQFMSAKTGQPLDTFTITKNDY